ncbi:MAG: Ig-like domain-containing protein, partial [Candidatus Calescibacterium sp.]
MVLIKIKKTNLVTTLLHIFLFSIPLVSSIISGCAQRTGKPPLEFKIIEFFPPAGFQMPLTSVPLKISIAFSKPVDQSTISDTTIKVFKDGNEIKKEIKITDRQKIELFPEISAQGKYKVFVSAKVKSIIGEELAEDFSWEFTITPITPERVTEIRPPELPPLIKKIYPEHRATVPQDTIVYVVFSKKIINLNTSNFYIQDINGKIVDADLTYLDGENIAILKPKKLLEPSQTYIVNLRSNITAQDGETLGVNIAWIFFTSGIGLDTTPPDVIFISPPNGATGVPIDTKIIIFFSEDI